MNLERRERRRRDAHFGAPRDSATGVDVPGGTRERVARWNEETRRIEGDGLLEIRIEPRSADTQLLPEQVLVNAHIEGQSAFRAEPRIAQGAEVPVRERSAEALK